MDISISVYQYICMSKGPTARERRIYQYQAIRISIYPYILLYGCPIKQPSATPLYRLCSNVQAAHNPFYYYRRDFLLLYSNLTVLISISMFIPTSPTGIPFWKIDAHKEFLNPLKKFASNWLVTMKIIISCLMFE